MQDEEHDVADTLKAPDFTGGGRILYDRAEMENIYRTGRGGIRVRAKYAYDKENNCIDDDPDPADHHNRGDYR